jgi:hypothetical protein
MNDANSDENKVKFREAIEKKRKVNVSKGKLNPGNPQLRSGQVSGKTQKMFRRKSGSS